MSNISGLETSIARPYPRHCTDCGKETVQRVTIDYDAAQKLDGRLYHFRVSALPIDKCQNCGEEFFTNETDEVITSAFRQFLGLLQPDDIKRRLAELGLSQKVFAERIGVAPESVSRWVNGLNIQTRAMDNLMRLFLAFDNVRSALALDVNRQLLGIESTIPGRLD